MKKRCFSIVLGIVILFSCVSNSFAFGEENKSSSLNVEVQIQNETNKRMNELIKIIEPQLEAQNAMEHLEIYCEVLAPTIEKEVRKEYGQVVSTVSVLAENVVRLYAEHGGMVTFTKQGYGPDGAPNAPTYFVYTYLNQLDTLHMILEEDAARFSVDTIAEYILGEIPYFGDVYSGLMDLQSLSTAEARASILEADGYTHIINMSIGSVESSVIIGWTDHPWMSPLEGAYDVQYEAFPEHDPFE